MGKVYSEDFKREAVRRVAQGEMRKNVAADLKITPSLITTWRQKLDQGARRQFDENFKRAAVLRVTQGESAAAVAADLKLVDSVMRGWVKKYAANGHAPAKGARKTAPAPTTVHDAIVFLKHAKRRITKLVASGEAQLDDPIYMLAMLALSTLEGKGQ